MTRPDVSPFACYFCERGDGHGDLTMSFDIEFDVYYHDDCADEHDVSSVYEYAMDAVNERD